MKDNVYNERVNIMSLHNIKAVVFDMDGVIFDTETIMRNMWAEAGVKYNLPNIENVILTCIGGNANRTEQILKAEYGQDFDYWAIKNVMSKEFHDRYDGGRLPMKDGVVETLEYLTGKGYRLALATSTRESSVIPEITDAGLKKYFEIIVCGDHVSKSKPDPEIFLTACEKLGVNPGEAVGIEDSYNGIRALKAAGMIPVMVPDLLPATEEMVNLAYTICDNLRKVQDLL